ncbi:nucleotidyltransferase domain-containing protein [Candidatus Woesearchaeota archaeon]|nr:nucleotidyltransferase domain-containing protein [Candidatus Woesearchaeota archaeon]
MMQSLKTELKPILSNKEIEVVVKRLSNKHLTQTESNYMSRSIKPKLKAAKIAANSGILPLLDYRRKKHERQENILKRKIIDAIRKDITLTDVKAIIIFGSYVRNCHAAYRDIDIMIVLNRRLWKTAWERNEIKKRIENECEIPIDVQLIDYNALKRAFSYSPLFQTELENHRTIYGSITLKKEIIIDNRHLYINLLDTEIIIELGKSIESKYIYNAIRMCLSIELFLKKEINNMLIIKTIEENIGKITAESLMNNTANKLQKEIGLKYLKYLYNKLESILK